MKMGAALSFETLIISHKSTLDHKSEAFLRIQVFGHHCMISIWCCKV